MALNTCFDRLKPLLRCAQSPNLYLTSYRMTPLKELNYGVTAQGSRLGIGHERPWNQRNSRCMGVSS